MAVDRPRRTSDGAIAAEAEWFRVVAWERLAGICREYLQQGSRVYVEGRLQSRGYTDTEGVARVAVEVIANDLLLIDGRAAPHEDVTSGNDCVAPTLSA